MFARLTTYDLDAENASDAAEGFQPAIDRIRSLDGLVEAFFLVECDGSRGVSITLWESMDSMERSRVAASRARSEAAEEIGAEVTSTYEYKVGIRAGSAPVDDGAAPTPPAA